MLGRVGWSAAWSGLELQATIMVTSRQLRKVDSVLFEFIIAKETVN
jgi:hypothetical protein